jgi:hypothetical protein
VRVVARRFGSRCRYSHDIDAGQGRDGRGHAEGGSFGHAGRHQNNAGPGRGRGRSNTWTGANQININYHHNNYGASFGAPQHRNPFMLPSAMPDGHQGGQLHRGGGRHGGRGYGAEYSGRGGRGRSEHGGSHRPEPSFSDRVWSPAQVMGCCCCCCC